MDFAEEVRTGFLFGAENGARWVESAAGCAELEFGALFVGEAIGFCV